MLLVSVVMVLSLSACSQTAPVLSTAAPAAPAHVVIEAKEFSFSPAQTTAKVGQVVEISLKNSGVTLHDFSIEKIALDGKAVEKSEDDGHMSGGMSDHMSGVDADKLAVHVAAEVGKSGTVTFTPTEPGEYEWYCTVAGHKASGMVGKLTVVR